MSCDGLLFFAFNNWITTHSHCLKPLIVRPWQPRKNTEGKLLVFAERAVTTDGRFMFPAELVQGRTRLTWPLFTLLTRLLVLCVACCIMWKTCQRPPTDWCAEPSCSVGEHWAVWFLCFYLLNVCVSPGLFCLMFSDVITGSRLYSVCSCSPRLPPSGGKRDVLKNHSLKDWLSAIYHKYSWHWGQIGCLFAFYFVPCDADWEEFIRPGFIGGCASVFFLSLLLLFSYRPSLSLSCSHKHSSYTSTFCSVHVLHSWLYCDCSSTGFSSFLLYKGWAI